ncbi:hypothetical protein KEH51_15720 [[Brevibacterium] frigoritolerans]|uniref:Uncharacterized protein n=1 Tax=Peribacillus frigoritolerans TaxID=450367 RepID=A0A941J5L6_9BACI|nr:hypothetical protein [Peribacillus frigoritolerans]
MIKIGENTGKTWGSDEFSLLINDMEVPNESGFIYKFPDGDFYAQINDWKYLKLVFNSTFIEAMSEIPTIYANLQVEFTDLIDGINIKKFKKLE